MFLSIIKRFGGLLSAFRNVTFWSGFSKKNKTKTNPKQNQQPSKIPIRLLRKFKTWLRYKMPVIYCENNSY